MESVLDLAGLVDQLHDVQRHDLNSDAIQVAQVGSVDRFLLAEVLQDP